MLLSFLLFSATSDACQTLPDWLYNCTIPRDSVDDNSTTYVVSCNETGVRDLECVPLVDCSGSIRTFSISCVPTTGKKAGTALVLSVFLGWLGADRFYLGYPTIGVFKLFTGGFFGLGWYLDVFMIALRVARPAGGIPYRFEAGANFRVRLPGAPYY
jgi:hypothetical protein